MASAEDELKAASRHWWEATADDSAARRRAPDVQPLVEALALPAGSTVLDAGCGAGALSLALARRGHRVRGIDLSPQMITHARAHAREAGLDEAVAQFTVGDVEQLPLPDASCDGVLCVNVLDFAPRPGVAPGEFRRVLRPGGRLVLLMLGAYSPVKRGAGHERWRRFLPDPPPVIPLTDILPWEMEALLGALGWHILDQAPIVAGTLRGLATRYTEEQVRQLPDRVVQHILATAWRFVARPD